MQHPEERENLQHSVYITSEEEMKEKALLIYTRMFASTHLSMSAATYRSRVCMLWCNKEEEKQSEIQCEDNNNAFIFLASRPSSATEVSQRLRPLLSSSWASRWTITVTNPGLPRTWKNASCFDVGDNHTIKISMTNEITHLLVYIFWPYLQGLRIKPQLTSSIQPWTNFSHSITKTTLISLIDIADKITFHALILRWI